MPVRMRTPSAVVMAEEVAKLRLILAEQCVSHDWDDKQLAAVLYLVKDIGVASDALAMRPLPRWLAPLLASA